MNTFQCRRRNSFMDQFQQPMNTQLRHQNLPVCRIRYNALSAQKYRVLSNCNLFYTHYSCSPHVLYQCQTCHHGTAAPSMRYSALFGCSAMPTQHTRSAGRLSGAGRRFRTLPDSLRDPDFGRDNFRQSADVTSHAIVLWLQTLGPTEREGATVLVKP